MEWEENRKLLEAAGAGDRRARDRLVEENIGLVWSVVRRFGGRGYDPEDLFQIGSIGLIKAVDKFDLTYEVRFSTYAIPIITGEIRRFLRDDGMISVSRSLKETFWRAKCAAESMGSVLGREPTIGELANELGIAPEELAAAMEAAAEIESLNRPLYQSEGKEIRLMDKLEEPEDLQEKMLNRLALEHALTELSPPERHLIFLRYFENRTQTQVAGELGISQVQVSRTEKKILKKMRQRWQEER